MFTDFCAVKVDIFLYFMYVSILYIHICRNEDEPKTPSTPMMLAPGKFSDVNRVDSQDSDATSESDETYKAPVSLETAHTSSSGYDSTLGNQLTVVRQSLFPNASKEAFEQAETSARVMDISARNRRACFAHTNSQQQKDEPAVAKIEAQSTSRYFDIY